MGGRVDSRAERAAKTASAECEGWVVGCGRIMRVGGCSEVRAPGTRGLRYRLVWRASNSDGAG